MWSFWSSSCWSWLIQPIGWWESSGQRWSLQRILFKRSKLQEFPLHYTYQYLFDLDWIWIHWKWWCWINMLCQEDLWCLSKSNADRSPRSSLATSIWNLEGLPSDKRTPRHHPLLLSLKRQLWYKCDGDLEVHSVWLRDDLTDRQRSSILLTFKRWN